MEKKKNVVLYVLLGIIIVLLAVIGLLLWKTMDKESPKEPETKEETQKEEKFEEISVEDALVKEAYSLIPRGICGDVEFELTKKDRTISDLSSKEKMEMIENHYRMAMLQSSEDKKFYVTDEELKKYFADVSFVKDYVENTPEKERRIGLADEILYNDGKLSMQHLYGTGCEGPTQGTISALYSAKKSDNKLELNVIVYTQEAIREEMDSDGNFHFVFAIYRDENRTEKGYEGYFEGRTAAKDNLDSTFFYGYQFIFNTAENALRLESIKYLDHLSDGL